MGKQSKRFNMQLMNPNFEDSRQQEKSIYNFLAETWTEISFQKSNLSEQLVTKHPTYNSGFIRLFFPEKGMSHNTTHLTQTVQSATRFYSKQFKINLHCKEKMISPEPTLT